MKRSWVAFALGFLWFQSISCIQDNFVYLQEELIPVHTDLQSGFEDREVNVYFNGQLSYSANLNSSGPLAGPIAQFSTQLLRGANSVTVEWWLHPPSSTHVKRTTRISLGSAPEYFLGFVLRNDSLAITVWDAQFVYF